jgi:hypothetical protein
MKVCAYEHISFEQRNNLFKSQIWVAKYMWKMMGEIQRVNAIFYNLDNAL